MLHRARARRNSTAPWAPTGRLAGRRAVRLPAPRLARESPPPGRSESIIKWRGFHFGKRVEFSAHLSRQEAKERFPLCNIQTISCRPPIWSCPPALVAHRATGGDATRQPNGPEWLWAAPRAEPELGAALAHRFDLIIRRLVANKGSASCPAHSCRLGGAGLAEPRVSFRLIGPEMEKIEERLVWCMESAPVLVSRSSSSTAELNGR